MNRDKLKTIMQKENLTRSDVADICKVSRRTVDSWFANGKAVRGCPDRAIALLECILKAKSQHKQLDKE